MTNRTVSLTMRSAVFAEETDEIFFYLLTITHPSLTDGPIYLSTDPTQRLSEDPLVYGTVSRGKTYKYLPISVVLPDDSDGTPPGITLAIANISRDLIPLVRSIGPTGIRAKVTVELMAVSDLETVQLTWPAFDMLSAPYDGLTLNVTLGIDALATEQFPAGMFTPSGFPGLF